MIWTLNVAPASALTSENELFSLAESRYHAKNYSIALQTYDEFLKEYPLSDLVPDVQYRRAVCHYRLGKYREALSLFTRIESRYRSTRYLDYIPFWAGMIFYHQADYSRAINSFDVFLSKTHRGEDVQSAVFYKGLCEVFLETYDEAKETLGSFLDNHATSSLYPSCVVLYAFVLLKTEQFDEVLSFTDISRYPSLSLAETEKFLFYRAEALWMKGETDEASSIYTRLLDGADDVSSGSFRRLFIAAQETGNIDEMERLLQKAEERYAGSPELLQDFRYNMGVVSFQRKNYELAEHFFLKIWNLRKSTAIKPAVPFYLSEVYMKRGKNATALEILEEYGGMVKRLPGFLLMRCGDIYLLQNDFTASAKYYRRFIDENPEAKELTEAYYYLAYTRYREGKYEEAFSIVRERLTGMTGGPYHKEFLKLQVVLYKKTGNIQGAYTALKQYIALYDNDIRARIDFIKLQFIRREYDNVTAGVYDLLRDVPDLEFLDSYTFLLSHYFQGLSFIVKKMYEKAFFSLEKIWVEEAQGAGLPYIIPYVQFYKAWALYRTKDFGKAALIFASLIKQYPEHELVPNALYLVGWCYYSDNKFDLARSYFEALSGKKPLSRGQEGEALYIKALFFQAKSLLNLDKTEEAGGLFRTIFEKYRRSPFADDALFEYASILAAQGKSDAAADAYRRLADNYRESPLREDAFYRYGEVYFVNRRYEKARYAFYEYRLEYPEGKLYDASLYWGGLASFQLGEKFGAVLLWEKIIGQFRESPFRPNAMKKTAEIYTESGEYSKALALYTELISSYPIEASAVNAEQLAEQLRYRILGLSDTEAELTVTIERNSGEQTKEGREALIELARLYLFEHGEVKREVAYQMLLKVVRHTEDTDTASRAQYLIGEYFYLGGDYLRAGNEYLKTALMNAENRDLMAVSIYKAAEMMKLAGKIQEVRELVSRLTGNFPSSQWAEEGKRLLEGLE
ncbi:MAG: tetratricopeptide repeat protein [Spirochaetales bacterium]|nr:tetratricopeptide repeat protein [Spirochaetales bacterium]